MATNPRFNPSFYKIMIDFSVELGLPEVFTKRYRALLPKKAKLRIASGATWEVRIQKMKNKQFYFTRGWTDFSRDMDLKRYEILVFKLVGKDTFHVTVFGVSAFEKASNFDVVVNHHDSGSSSSSSDNFYPSWPRFKATMTNRTIYQLYVKREYVRAMGLIEGERVRFEYPGGSSVEVKVHCTVTKTAFRAFNFQTGWVRFQRENGLTIGKTYTFELVPSPTPTPTNIKVIRVQPFV